MPGREEKYKSLDTVLDTAEATEYPIEFLNSLELPGVPPHILKLKEGAPIMLLRNLDPPRLVNGTRLVVKKLNKHVIEATILCGAYEGEDVFIPRIPLIPNDLPFSFKRLQFPIRPCYAMSINKSQGEAEMLLKHLTHIVQKGIFLGQSLLVAGLQLEQPCFSHGQLYVAASRVGSRNNLFVLAPNGRTRNIVYKSILS